MASNVVNSQVSLSGGVVTPAVTRGRTTALGSLAGTTDVVQFAVTENSSSPDGLEVLVITTSGGAITPVLSCSIDGGTSWFTINPRAAAGTAPNFTSTAPNSDPATTSANAYEISGLQATAVFRFGGRTAGTVVVSVSVS